MSSIRVGIVDTGLLDVSEFNVVAGHNFALDGNARYDITSKTFHGSIVASIITNIAPNVELVIAKMLDDEGIGNPKKATRAIKYCIANNCDIINCSIAGPCDCELEDVIEEAYKNNIWVVAATGNDGKDKILYPAGYHHCISVGSINRDHELSYFSNYNALMDLLALGEDVVYRDIIDSGTSYAAPVVTGTLASLLEIFYDKYNRRPSWQELYDILISNCTRIDDLSIEKQGNGYINIKKIND